MILRILGVSPAWVGFFGYNSKRDCPQKLQKGPLNVGLAEFFVANFRKFGFFSSPETDMAAKLRKIIEEESYVISQMHASL